MSARTSSHVDFPIRVMSLADIARQSIKIQWVLLARPLRASRPDHKAGSVADPARPPNIIPNVRKIDAPRDWESVPEFDSISLRSLPGRRRIEWAGHPPLPGSNPRRKHLHRLPEPLDKHVVAP